MKPKKKSLLAFRTDSFLKRFRKNRQRLLVISLVGLIGVALLLSTSAAVVSSAIEPETGTTSGLVHAAGDLTASGDSAVFFGTLDRPELMIYNTKNDLDQLKAAVSTSGYKQSYWNYVKVRQIAQVNPGFSAPLIPADWSQNVTWQSTDGTQFSFNPRRLQAIDHTTSNSLDTQGNYMVTGATNAYTCGLRWRIDGDTTCGNAAINYIDTWSRNFEYARSRSQIDGRDNQVKLNSGWYVVMITRAAEVVWDHPSFTVAKKQQFANWLWEAFLNEDAIMNEVSAEVLGMSGAGWNGRTLVMQARLNSGLIMRAAGYSSGNAVIKDIQDKIDLYLPEILYYGKGPWHETLGQPWPNQPFYHLNTNYNGNASSTGTRTYWFFRSNSSMPPPFFIGQSQETGRDMGHHQSGAGSVAEILRALRINGFEDRYASTDLGNIMLQMGERHAKFYNQALDEFWNNRSKYSSIESLTGKWVPPEWPTLQLSKDQNTTTSFEVGGASADFGWEVLRKELKAKNYNTPELDRLTARLRGHGGTRTSTYGAGFRFIQSANHLAWDPLFGVQ